jgi:hypothetical protein
MKLAAAASWLHKWLALIIGVQILFWFASGLFFALYPIERVRSEHRIADFRKQHWSRPICRRPARSPRFSLRRRHVSPMSARPPAMKSQSRSFQNAARS